VNRLPFHLQMRRWNRDERAARRDANVAPTPDLAGIDWTASAVDLMDALMDRWYDAHGDDEHDRLAEAEAWAERMFGRYAE